MEGIGRDQHPGRERGRARAGQLERQQRQAQHPQQAEETQGVKAGGVAERLAEDGHPQRVQGLEPEHVAVAHGREIEPGPHRAPRLRLVAPAGAVDLPRPLVGKRLRQPVVHEGRALALEVADMPA